MDNSELDKVLEQKVLGLEHGNEVAFARAYALEAELAQQKAVNRHLHEAINGLKVEKEAAIAKAVEMEKRLAAATARAEQVEAQAGILEANHAE